MTTTISVRFDGGRSGRTRSTWGQRAIWGAMRDFGEDHHLFNTPFLVSNPDGWTVDAVTAGLRELLGLHESLRTRMGENPDGTTWQELDARGEVTVELLDAGGDEQAVLDEVRARFLREPFDYAREWSVRVAAVCGNGLVRHVFFVVSHHVADGESWVLLINDYAALANGVPAEELTRDRIVFQPLDHTAYQESEDGVRQNAKALRYWENKLRTVPVTMFPAAFVAAHAQPREPRFWQARLTSRAVGAAAAHLADRWRTSSTTIVLAAWSKVLAEITGNTACTIMVIINNRIQPRWRHVVSSIALEGIFSVETAGVPFEEVVQRAKKASLASYRHGDYDKDQLNELVRVIGAERGAEVDRGCWFNDMRFEPAGRPDVPLAEALADPSATLEWTKKFDTQGDETVSLHMMDVPGRPDLMQLSFTADTHVMAPEIIEKVLRDMNDLLLGEAVVVP
ncbi:condensation domain-containing protein [Lentzea sp. NPDC006480]|uniref:condensation domain-containing protein n=1 Tax=Lentzea sp. NPDC006480 TaxID=3157176 RepID=UPI0033B135F4